MSNDNDEQNWADRYNRETKREHELNKEREEAERQWNEQKGPKPDLEMLRDTPPRTEQEIHDVAKARADQGYENDQKLRKAGLTREQQGGTVQQATPDQQEPKPQQDEPKRDAADQYAQRLQKKKENKIEFKRKI